MQTSTQRVQKLVTFSSKLYDNAIARANSLGIPFAEYVRHVVIKDIEKDIDNLPMVDNETNKRIGQSLKDIEEGRFIEVDPSNEEELNRALEIK
jgi:hypothetical protein